MTTKDFTGGINLSRNIMQLAPDESPDLMNVDVHERGGFRLRRGVETYANAGAAAAVSLHSFRTSNGTQQVLATDGTNLRWSTGAAWTTIAARTGVNRSVQFKDNLYLNNGVGLPFRWDGSTKTDLTQTFNNDLANPNQGDMPVGKVMAVYRGCVFVANTLESATNFPSRIRWSHPNQPEDYETLAWIDVDTGHDGDEITALVPYDDRLLIFKKHSTHVLFGDPPDGFSVFPMSPDVGTISQEAVAVTDHGVYFFDWPSGVYRFSGTGKSLEWVFERLYPAIKDGGITAAHSGQIQMGFGNNRVWLSVPWGGSATRNRVFVLAPKLGKGGAWVKYDLAVGPFLTFKPDAGVEQRLIAGSTGSTRLLRLEANKTTDNIGAGEVPINAWYVTSWFDLGEPALRKKWRRPEVVLIDGQDSQVLCQVFRDFDPTVPVRSFRFVTSAVGGSTLVWDAASPPNGWDVGEWADGWDEKWKVDKGSPMGSGRAVMLRFSLPDQTVDWGVNALTLKVIVRPVRS